MDTEENLQNLFDAQLKSILIRFDRENHYIGGLYQRFGAESQIDFPQPGLTVLLGKNGSGKTNLLRGLNSLSGETKIQFPKIKLIFDWPSKNLLIEWAHLARESLVPLKPLKIMLGTENDLTSQSNTPTESPPHSPDLPLMSTVISALKSPFNPEFPAPFEDLKSSEILQFFDFTDSQISHWQSMQAYKRNLLNDQSLQDLPLNDLSDIEEKYHIANFCIDAFLRGILQSTLINRGYAPIPQFHADLWIQIESNRTRFRKTYEEFFDLISKFSLTRNYLKKVHLSRNTSMWKMTLLAPVGTSEILQNYCEEYAKIQTNARNEFAEFEEEDEQDIPLELVEMGFPFSLLSPITIDGEKYLESHAFDLPDIGGSNSANWPMNLLEVSQFDPSNTQTAELDLLQELSTRLLSVNLKEGTDNLLNIELSGLTELSNFIDDVSFQLSRTECGIAAIRSSIPIAEMNPQDVWSPRTRGVRNKTFDSGINPLVINLEWQDKYSEEWLPLSYLSLGQRDILAIFVKLLSLQYGEMNKKYRLLLIDEFDKHLHASSTELVLAGIHDFASSQGLSVIVSTHSIPLLKSNQIRNRPRIFATRDAINGGFRYTDGGYTDPLTIAEVVGSSEVDALRFKDVIVVLEGDHDQLIIEKYINQVDESLLERIHITHASGLDGFQGLWRNFLRLVDNKVLFIYDKKSDEIENGWSRIKDANSSAAHNSKAFEPLSQIFRDSKYGGNYSHGSHEKRKILYLLKDVCEYVGNIDRVDIHGVEYDDIVDSLPFRYFSNSKYPDITSWDVAHLRFTKGADLKAQFGIDIGKLKNVLGKTRLQDPELEKIVLKIKQLLGR